MTAVQEDHKLLLKCHTNRKVKMTSTTAVLKTNATSDDWKAWSAAMAQLLRRAGVYADMIDAVAGTTKWTERTGRCPLRRPGSNEYHGLII